LRFLDIATAILLGSSAITGMAVWTPRNADAGTQTQLTQMDLRDALLRFMQQPGEAWILRSSPEELCTQLSSFSNTSETFLALVNGHQCTRLPPGGSPVANLTFDLFPGEVVLEAWPTAQG
jgi:hypothetical protein